MAATPREIVQRYVFELHNQHRFQLVDDLLADEVTHHEVGGKTTMTRAGARWQIEARYQRHKTSELRLQCLIAEGEYVCIVFERDSTGRDGRSESRSGMQVFRVVDGLITDVWTSYQEYGAWSSEDAEFVGAPPDWGALPCWPDR